MFVESLFWFYPLVWLIKARLIDEQERACDEEVLRNGGDPHIYVESILKICEFYLTTPLPCVSGITGANLKKRIGDIMRERIGLQLSLGRAGLLTVAAAAALIIPIVAGAMHAATPLAAVVAPIAASTAPGLVAEPQSAKAAAPVVQVASTARSEIAPTVVIPALPALLQAGDSRGHWNIQSQARGLQLSLFSADGGNSSQSLPFDAATFRGLSLAQISSPIRTAARFEIVRDAGTFICQGEFQSGTGAGEFVFRPNPDFVQRMAAEGLTGIRDRDLVALALLGVPGTYMSDLRAAGLGVPGVNQMIGMWVQGVTADYIRDMQQAGYTPDANGLIGMRVQGVTPEFARDVQQMFRSVSMNNLIGMRVQGVTTEFAREVLQTFPSASINQLIGMRVQGVTMEFAREVQQIYPTASINDLIGMRVQGVTPELLRQARQTDPRATINDVIGMKVRGSLR
jgi:BlaR1 peptidase M56